MFMSMIMIIITTTAFNIELLVRNGVNINYKDKLGITALHLACYKGQDDNVEFLIKNNAEINSKDELGSKLLI
jgi:ankyrin repeat protein